MSHAVKEPFCASAIARQANQIAMVAIFQSANRYSMFRISSPRRGRDDKPTEAHRYGANQR